MPRPPKIPVPASPEKQAAGPLRLKRWTFAGLLLTYQCNARCAFCYLYCGPHKTGPWMEHEHALALWRDLNRLVDEGGSSYGRAGERHCKVHLAGGEPFLDYPRLLALITAVRDQGLRGLEKVETNAFWATSDDVVRQRLTELKDAGLPLLLISADVYHQEFVPVERCQRAARIAREILGEKGVRVRWWDCLTDPADLHALTPEQRRQIFAAALVEHRDRLLGRAADELADLYETHAPEHFRDRTCVESTLGSRHVHIDPGGHVTPGVCAGILWGTVPPLRSTPPAPALPQNENRESKIENSHRFLHALWDHAAEHWPEHPIISQVVAGGPYRLYQHALLLGFTPRADGYASKCHLCHDVRRFLFERQAFPGALGPAEVYSDRPAGLVDQCQPISPGISVQ